MPVYEFLGLRAVFESTASQELLLRLQKVAQSQAVVLIQGESGSGKEMVARAIHHYSPRNRQAWVDISCAALPEHLVESELFGYEKGAFSGADGCKPGLFEIAHRGTLFLDEIGDLPPRVQVKFLRALECGSFFRLGGTRKVTVDVRVVAATNLELREAVKRGEFREDLYHRLAQISVEVPPLRGRRTEIPVLASLFLEEVAPGRRLHISTLRALENYDWPGNVRELRNVIVSGSIEAGDGPILPGHLPEQIRQRAGEWSGISEELLALAEHVELAPGDDPSEGGGLLDSIERRVILEVLERTQGHQEKAARVLGISSRTLSRKLRSYQLKDHSNELPRQRDVEWPRFAD